jgi:hypothetical protein
VRANFRGRTRRTLSATAEIDCNPGDTRWAYFPGDTEERRKVELRRRDPDNCEWWVSWHHDRDMCDDSEAGNYCSYSASQLFLHYRNDEPHCENKCATSIHHCDDLNSDGYCDEEQESK